MAGTVVVAEARDGLRIELDLAARRAEAIPLRIGPEGVEEHPLRFEIGNLERSSGPELLEGRRVDAGVDQALTDLRVEMLDPGALVAAFGEGFGEAEALGEAGQDGVIVART